MHPTTQRPADLHGLLVAHDPMRVTALIEANLDQDGLDVRGMYLETDWLALLGPSTTRFISMGRTPAQGRRIALRAPGGFVAPLRHVARVESGLEWRVGVYAGDHEGP
ncbi:MAG: hypothetical protein ACLPVY_07280 [Acidimicrobiia bacterium]